MTKPFLLLLFIIACIYDAASQTPSLGSYPAITTTESSNIAISPSAPPANATRIIAYATPRFKGVISVSPATGIVKITNARPAGTYTISIKAYNGSASGTAIIALQVNNPVCNQTGRFGAPVNVTNGNGAWAVRVADFNNDDKQDIAISNYNSNSVSIRLGDGAGNFSGTTDVPVGAKPERIAVSDFNGDGNPDFATANYASNTISIRLGNGTGTFSNTAEIPVGNSPSCVVSGDFNNDGLPDLLAGNFGNSTISVCIGNGTGNFTVSRTISAVGFPNDIATSDFNGDGLEDFVVNNYAQNKVSVYQGTGLGNFVKTTEISFTGAQGGVITGDFNGDGKQDIAVTNQENPALMIYAGTATGTFNLYYQVTLSGNPSEIATGDLDGDGRPDLLTGDGSNITLIYNYATGFGTYPYNIGHSFNNSIAAGDFNGDGRSDFVSTNYISNYVSVVKSTAENISVQGNNTVIVNNDSIPGSADFTDFGTASANLNRNFTISNTGTYSLNINSIAFSGPDAASFSASGTNTYATYIQPGGSATLPVTFAPTSAGLKTAAVKINNSVCNSPVYSFTIRATAVATALLGNYPNKTVATGSNINITPASAPASVTNITATTSPAFKGLLTVNPATGVVTVQNAHPAGVYVVIVRAFTSSAFFILTVNNPTCSQAQFAGTINTTTGSVPKSVAVGDFNGDGKPDIITANSSSYNVSVLLGNGNGGSSSTITTNVNAIPIAIALSDFNSDGRLDFVIASSGSPWVRVGFGDGTGNFPAIKDVLAGNGPQSIVVADFNRDGKADFATANSADNTISIRLGNGVGEFVASTDVMAGNMPFGMATADFDNDSRTDLAVTNYASNSVTIYMGDGNGGCTPAFIIPAGTNPRSIVTGDFNKDGIPDFATANGGSNTVSVRLGNVGGGFANAPDINTGTTPYVIAAGDFNGDGQPDLVINNFGSNNIAVRLGDGTGNFSIATNVATAAGPAAIAVSDLNGDGQQDLVTANATAGNVSVRLANNGNAEIELKGNNTAIPDGCTTALPGNYTDFTDTAGLVTHLFIIQNTGTGPLTINRITVTGTDSAAFIVATLSLPVVISAGRDTGFTIRFTPVGTGLKTATITIYNDDCDENVYDFLVQGRQRISGSALSFDGANDYITINDTLGNVAASDLTLSVWIRTAATGLSTIVSKRSACTGGNGIELSCTASGRAAVKLSDSTVSQVLTGNQIINDSLWHQVNAVRRGDTLRLYTDAYPDTMLVTTDVVAISNSALLTIGASSDCSTANNYFRGQIDEVKLYNRALNTGEIQRHAFCELDTSRLGLLAYYNFNQGFAQENNAAILSLADSGISHANGLLHNFAMAGNVSNWVAPGAIVSGTICTGRSVWLGLTPDWNQPENWSGRFVPSEFTRVIINGSMPFMPEITSPSSTCYSLTLSNGAIVRVKPGGHLTIRH